MKENPTRDPTLFLSSKKNDYNLVYPKTPMDLQCISNLIFQTCSINDDHEEKKRFLSYEITRRILNSELINSQG